MKKILVLLALTLLLLPFLNAQERAGNIEGRVVTVDGEALPGVLVTLTSDVSAKMTAVTNEQGIFRFKSLAPSRNYQITAELEGFNKAVQKEVQVTVGVTSSLKITLELGQITKEILIEGKAAVVDSKSTSVAQVMTREELQSLPTARDPWVILQMAPSIQMDRQNVGGSESGQQSSYVGRGGDRDNNIWNMDGINITDPSATGASPTYFDFDAFEEMNVTIGGADVVAQTGGVQMNMVTRRGGNKTSIGGRYYLSDEYFQTENITEDMKAEGLADTNKIISIKDYGFNVGGPVLKDKLFYWFSAGNQNIHNVLINGADDKTNLTNYAGKLNVQLIPNNRFEFFYHAGAKTKFGRGAGNMYPSGQQQGGQFHFGSPIFKIQDELTIGDNFFISVKYNHTDAGFKLAPMIDVDYTHMAIFDIPTSSYTGSYWNYDVKRPKDTWAASLNYFNDNLGGGTHEFKIGFEYTKTNSETRYDDGYYYLGPEIRTNYNRPMLDLDGDGYQDIPTGWEHLAVGRTSYRNQFLTLNTFYFQDTATYGNITVKLGVRYDSYNPWLDPFTVDAVWGKSDPRWTDYFTSAAVDAIERVVPGVNVPEVKDCNNWNIISPRLGITWDINGDGKTIAKLSLGKYGGVMGTWGSDDYRFYGTSGWNDYWMMDNNGDGLYGVDELYWHGADYKPYQLFDAGGNIIGDIAGAEWYTWGGYDVNNPQKVSPTRIDTSEDYNGGNTYEAILTLQKEVLKDFGLSLNFTLRKYDGFSRDVYRYPDEGNRLLNKASDYRVAGTIPGQVGPYSTDEAAGKSWYVRTDDYTRTSYESVIVNEGRYQNYWAVDVVATKRLSNKWMMTGSFTYQNQSHNWDDESYYGNPTNFWAYNGQPFSSYMGAASGKISQHVYSRWMLKFSGLYQLPLDINISATFLAREGNIMDHYFTMRDNDLPNPQARSASVRTQIFGSDRLPVFVKLDLRLEKLIRVGENMKIYLMVDAFNALNSATELRRYQYNYGTYYVHDGSFVPGSTIGKLNEVLTPRIFRFGLRFQF